MAAPADARAGRVAPSRRRSTEACVAAIRQTARSAASYSAPAASTIVRYAAAGSAAAEHRRPRDEESRRRPRRRRRRSSASMPPSTSISAFGASSRSRGDLRRRGRDEGLASPAGVDGHAEDDVGELGDLGCGASTGVPGLIASPARQPASRIAARVRWRCGSASAWIVIESAPALANSAIWSLGPLDHQVDVDRAAGVVDLVGDRRRDQRADRDRRDEVAVHDVDVDHAGAGVDHLADLGAEAGEVGGEDRGRDPALAVEIVAVGRLAAQTGFSIEWPQCWQSRSSSALMRTIVWCSPQLGHRRRARSGAGSRRSDSGPGAGSGAATARRSPGSRAGGASASLRGLHPQPPPSGNGR